MDDIIKVVQLPVIEQRLRAMKEDIELDVSAALALDCTEETVKDVKKMRARLNKDYGELEQQRKTVQKVVFTPWDDFIKTYNECVTNTYRSADSLLKGKIDDVESEIKRRCEESLRAYFNELCAANHVEWLSFEQTGVKVDMASAKQKTPKKLRGQLIKAVDAAREAMNAISGMENAEELAIEYKRSLNLSEAIRTVEERHRRIEAEREARVRFVETTAQEQDAVRKVEALEPPIHILRPDESEEDAIMCQFIDHITKKIKVSLTLHPTRLQYEQRIKPILLQLKEICDTEGIQYE